MSITDEILEQLSKLDETQQQQLLNYARVLMKTSDIKGESGASIITATGFFDEQSLNEMEAAIQNCSQ